MPTTQVPGTRPKLSQSKNTAQVIHHLVNGRTRLRSHDLKQNPGLAAAIESALSATDGVSNVQISLPTGSILVLHGKDIERTKLAELVDQEIEHFWEKMNPKAFLAARSRVVRRPGRRPIRASDPNVPSWHALDTSEILGKFKTTRSAGLKARDVEALRALQGSNRLAKSEPETGVDLFLNQFKNPAVYILIGSAGLSIVTGGLSEALVLGVVIVGNAYVGYRMEHQANRSLSILAKMATSDVVVLRSGGRRIIPADELVAGDIMLLSSGVSVPADARILECEDLSVDESPLTGESEPVQKTSEKMPNGEPALADRKNMLYRGTLIITGTCVAVAVAVGARTEIGRIQSLISEIEAPRTHLQAQLDALTQQLLLITLLTTTGVFAVGLLRGRSKLEMINLSISLIITAIPEGLTTVATTALAQAALSVRKDNVLVRKLDSIEALGATQVLCVDKTGTLTLNQMKVASVFDGQHWYELTGREITSLTSPDDRSALLSLLEVAILCNDATIDSGKLSAGRPALNGSATEKALLELALECRVDLKAVREASPRLKTQLRSHSYKIMSTLHQRQDGSKFLAVKGSPDEVLELCAYFYRDGVKHEMTAADRETFTEANRTMSTRALRVLGIAYRDEKIEEAHLHSNRDLIWLGLTGMRDQIREGMKELVAAIHRAGIEMKMITGDQGLTAAAVARELDFTSGKPLKVMDGDSWQALKSEGRKLAVQEFQVFARINPNQKLEIVEALKDSGKVVAMVGDGINDAAALHMADVGISMGKNGTQVSREVANVVLMDDDLRNLLPAIRAGRANHDNINKAVNFLLATNLSETLILGGSVILGFDSPLSAIQLLWINLISDVFPALALAMDPPTEDILAHPPHSRDEELITREDFRSLVGEASGMALVNLAAYGYGFAKYGPGPRAQTLAFMNLNTSQVLHTISASTKGRLNRKGVRTAVNPYVKMSVAAGFALEGMSLLVPFVRVVLGNTRLSLVDFSVGGALAMVNFGANQAVIRKSRPKPSRTFLKKPALPAKFEILKGPLSSIKPKRRRNHVQDQ